MKKILVIGTYPIIKPQHGGQKRLEAICNEYERFGNNVRYVAVYHKQFYATSGKYDIAIPAKYSKEINSSPFTGDIVIGKAIYENEYVRNKIVKLIEEFKPDVIHIEQVFPYMGLKSIFKDIGYNNKIVYGSQNIEYLMKRQMLNSLGFSGKITEAHTQKIYEAEKDLSAAADMVAAVSLGDIKEHERLGAKNCILAPNGIYRRSCSPKTISRWANIFRSMGVDKIILFVGSAHPPNWIGFQDMIGRGLGFMPANSRIVFAGSISDYVEEELNKMKYDVGGITFRKRAYFAGRLSEEKLVGLLGVADTIILPITEGGGSNLKTAEAIVSGKKIVATSFAFRGFEKLKNLPNIDISDSQDEFRQLIIKSMNSKIKVRSMVDDELSNAVLWQNCLLDLNKEVSRL